MPVARPSRRAATSKVLVVDASVMRAAGGEGATDPAVFAHARDALEAILTICHKICVSPELREEWKRHRSRFAQLWWRQMYARRKVIDCVPPSCAGIPEDIG